jgi:hypothetical protein
MTDEANSASNFPTDPGSTGNQGHDLSLVVVATPEVLDEEGFSSIPRSFANAASQYTSTQLRSLAHVVPAVLNDFIGGVDSRDSETRRLNDRIVALEQAKSDLLAENAALASALEASKLVVAATPEVLDEEGFSSIPCSVVNATSQNTSTQLHSLAQVAPAVLNDFVGGVDSRDLETRGLNDKIVVLEQAQPDLQLENAVFANAPKASKRESNFAKILIALGGSLAGLGFHQFGSQTDGREAGIAIMAIGVGLGLISLGWFFRPKGE